MEFKLPEIGEGVQEGELIRWLVKEGDVVAQDQALLEVMTDKATVEIPAPAAGAIRGLVGQEGQMIKVGQVLATIESGGASVAPAKTSATPSASPSVSAAATTPAAAPAVPKMPATPAPAAIVPAQGASFSSTPTGAAASASSVGAYSGALDNLSASSVPAAPIVRAMAAKVGVDLSVVPASGPAVGGKARVLEEDLIQYLATRGGGTNAATAAPARSIAGVESTERRPVRGLRRVIAQAMVKSKYTAPHYSYVDEFECSSLVDLREQAKKIGETHGVKVTYLPFVVKALVAALKEFPEANSSLEENANGMELVLKKHYHIGFAVATKDGLVVPVIKHADQKSLLEIAREINELSAKVRAGKASPDELRGSTFSITSMGNVGGLFATPIINYPEVGILGVYKVQEKPIVKNGQIVIGKTMHLSLSLDHRVVDGAVGGAFCNAIIDRLSSPARLLMDLV